ncbi:uncharacterized protein LOC144301744 [Canis aureus]
MCRGPRSAMTRTRRAAAWGYSRKAGRESGGGWEEREDGEDKDGCRPGDLHGHLSLEMELRRGSILGSHLEEDVDSKTETEVSSSESWLSMSRHTPHGAYWIEQQNRLPLPLMEVVENEALEILTKALWTPLLGSPCPAHCSEWSSVLQAAGQGWPRSLPDQAAAAIHRGAQEASEQEAAPRNVLRTPLPAQVTDSPTPAPHPCPVPRTKPDPVHVEFES